MHLLARLADGGMIAPPAALVVAHPDDETIGCGGRLDRFEALTLIQVTDGAPPDLRDAKAAGFSTCEAYATARADERTAALAALGARARLVDYGVADQGAVERLGEMVERLVDDLSGQALVLTHPYEGGHPDHDACALAVAVACRRLGRDAPARLEFASYHQDQGRFVVQRFWPDPSRPSVEVRLSPADRARKAAAFEAYATQAEVLANFSPEREGYRQAPDYDFAGPPPPGAWLYDRFGFALKGQAWLERAQAALAEMAATA